MSKSIQGRAKEYMILHTNAGNINLGGQLKIITYTDAEVLKIIEFAVQMGDDERDKLKVEAIQSRTDLKQMVDGFDVAVKDTISLQNRVKTSELVLQTVKRHWMNSSHCVECPCISSASIFDRRCLCGYDEFEKALDSVNLLSEHEKMFKCGEDVAEPEGWWSPSYDEET